MKIWSLRKESSVALSRMSSTQDTTHTCVFNSSILFQVKSHCPGQIRYSRYQLWKNTIRRAMTSLRWLKSPVKLQMAKWHLSKESWNLYSVGLSSLTLMQVCLITYSHCQPGKVQYCRCERKYSSFWCAQLQMKMYSHSKILLSLSWEMQDSCQTPTTYLRDTAISSKQLVQTQMASTQWPRRNQTYKLKT